jgi:hypothetical protein
VIGCASAVRTIIEDSTLPLSAVDNGCTLALNLASVAGAVAAIAMVAQRVQWGTMIMMTLGGGR